MIVTMELVLLLVMTDGKLYSIALGGVGTDVERRMRHAKVRMR